MKVFVTGGSGYVGRHVLPLLKDHTVTALVRSDEAAAAVAAQGATPVRGSLSDLDVIKAAAASADATIHLAFDHSFFTSPTANGGIDHHTPARLDAGVINAVGEMYAKDGKVLIMSSGTLLGAGRHLTDSVLPGQLGSVLPRAATEVAAEHWGQKGARAVIIRLSPTVHGGEFKDWSFMRGIVEGDKKAGYAAIVGDGSNVWPAVNVTDAADLYVRALEYVAKQPAGLHIFHAVGELNSIKSYAEIIARKLAIPVKSVTPDEIADSHGFLAGILGLDNTTSAEITRATLGWEPKGTTIVQELEDGSAAFFG